MYMTEDEARAKWCPMAERTWEHGPAEINEAVQRAGQELMCCLGSNCAVWCWKATAPRNDEDRRCFKGRCGLIPLGPMGAA